MKSIRSENKQEGIQNKSILGLLGLAIRARQVKGGATAAEVAIRTGKAKLILLAQDSAENTRKLFTRLAERHNIPLLEQHTREEFGHHMQSAPRAVITILDPNFATGMLKKAGIKPLWPGKPH